MADPVESVREFLKEQGATPDNEKSQILSFLTAPTRTAYNAALLPIDVGADALRRGVHAALGLKEKDPWRYTGERSSSLGGAFKDLVGPPSDAISKGMSALRDTLVEQGALPDDDDVPPPRSAAPSPRAPGAAPDPGQPRFAPRGTSIPQRAQGGTWPAGGRPSTPRPPVGALSMPRGTPAPVEGMGVEAMPQPAVLPQAGALSAGEAVPPPVMAPRRSLGDRYAELTAGIPRDRGDKLTPDQKLQMQLDFYLNLMSRGGKPGARFLTAAGDAGLDVSEKVRKAIEGNKRDAHGARAEARDEAFRQIGFEDKDDDNVRASRQLSMLEKHYAAQDSKAAEQLRIAREQLEQGKFEIKATPQGYIKYDKKTGRTEVLRDPVTGRPIMPAETDRTPAELRILRALQADPELRELYGQIHGRREGSLTDKDLVDTFLRANHGSSDMRPATDIARDAVEFARRGGRPGPAKPDPAPNKGRTISGPDGRFQSDGKQWVRISGGSNLAQPTTQAEFDNLPKGTEFLNPKDGKVYTKN